jgi:hypothetical protein
LFNILVHIFNPVDGGLKRKIAGSREPGDEIPACLCRIKVAENDRDIADVQVGGVPEQEKLEDGREKDDEEHPPVPPELDEFLTDDMSDLGHHFFS